MTSPSTAWARLAQACAAVAVAALGGCGSGGGDPASPPGSGAGTPPPPPPPAFALQTSSPNDGATGLGEVTPVTLTFSGNVAPATVSAASVRITTADGEIPATLTVSGSTVVVTPTRWLAPRQLHTVSVDATVSDTQGHRLPVAGQVRFTTAGPSWQPATDASFTACDAVSQPALMDDGTLLLACTGQGHPTGNAPVWKRSPAGTWSVLANPPTSTARAASLQKVSGTRAAISWIDPSSTAGVGVQPWDTTSGIGAFTANWAPYDRLVRARKMQQSEAPPGVTVKFEQVFEVVDTTSGQVVSSVPSLIGQQAQQTALCYFESGAILLLTSSFAPGGQSTPFTVSAYLYRRSGGWQAPRTLASGLYTNPSYALFLSMSCSPKGGARAFWFDQAGSVSQYVDWYDPNWQPVQQRSSTGGAVLASQLYSQFVWGADGSVYSSWFDYAPDPQGLFSYLGVSYRTVPRNFAIWNGATYFVPDSGMPNNATSGPLDAAIYGLGYDQSQQRFMALISSGPSANQNTKMAFRRANGAWSNPWSVPGVVQASDWRMDFNATGAGVLVGRSNGQTLVSEWR